MAQDTGRTGTSGSTGAAGRTAGSSGTGTADVTYNLISIAYHALQGAEVESLVGMQDEVDDDGRQCSRREDRRQWLIRLSRPGWMDRCHALKCSAMRDGEQ